MAREITEELGLGDLLQVLWRGWLVLGAATVCLAVVGGLLTFILNKKFTASTQVIVASRDGAGGLGGLGAIASQFGAVASLAGISLGEDGSRSEYVAVLQSDALTREFIERNDLLPVLYSGQWDPVRQDWNVRRDEDRPTLWKATQYFNRSVRSIRDDKASGLITLTITWRDPELAEQWANGLISLANSHLQAKRLGEAERNIEYLKAQAENADVAQVRNAIFSVMESEIKSAMIARGADEFAFRTVSAAIAPEIPSFPNPLLLVFAGAFVGFAGASTYLLVRYAWKGG